MSDNNREQMEQFSALVQRLVELCNETKNEGMPVASVNAAMISACATYATYAAAGNNGYLQQTGVDKTVAAFRRQLTHIQKIKKQQLNPDG